MQQRYLIRNVVQLGAADCRKRCSIGSCGLSETLFNWKLRIVINVVQLEAADFQKVVQLEAADCHKRCSIGTTCPDAANDLCRPHVPFLRCDKGCPR